MENRTSGLEMTLEIKLLFNIGQREAGQVRALQGGAGTFTDGWHLGMPGVPQGPRSYHLRPAQRHRASPSYFLPLPASCVQWAEHWLPEEGLKDLEALETRAGCVLRNKVSVSQLLPTSTQVWFKKKKTGRKRRKKKSSCFSNIASTVVFP